MESDKNDDTRSSRSGLVKILDPLVLIVMTVLYAESYIVNNSSIKQKNVTKNATIAFLYHYYFYKNLIYFPSDLLVHLIYYFSRKTISIGTKVALSVKGSTFQ